MEDVRPGFPTVVFVLFAIFLACCLFIGLSVKEIPPFIGGLSLLVWVALPHAIGLYLSIRDGHIDAAIVIMAFLGFWLCLGMGFMYRPGEVHKVLLFIEPGIALVVFVMQAFYAAKQSLRYILIHLGGVVTFLWLSKLVPVLEIGIPYMVGLLGIGTMAVAIHQLRLYHRAVRAYIG